jgi:hypothetical protein
MRSNGGQWNGRRNQKGVRRSAGLTTQRCSVTVIIAALSIPVGSLSGVNQRRAYGRIDRRRRRQSARPCRRGLRRPRSVSGESGPKNQPTNQPLRMIAPAAAGRRRRRNHEPIIPLPTNGGWDSRPTDARAAINGDPFRDATGSRRSGRPTAGQVGPAPGRQLCLRVGSCSGDGDGSDSRATVHSRCHSIDASSRRHCPNYGDGELATGTWPAARRSFRLRFFHGKPPHRKVYIWLAVCYRVELLCASDRCVPTATSRLHVFVWSTGTRIPNRE